MDRTERFHLIDQLLTNNRSISRDQFLSALEISLATFKRDIEYMRDRLGAPIVWQRDLNAYVYEKNEGDQNFQLPGLWFNTAEIHALMTMDALLENIQQGLLSDHIKPLRVRIKALLEQGDYDVDEIGKRIRVLTAASKTYKSTYFQILNQALFSRKRILITHYNRQKDSVSERELSPQRLTFYRDNWYLDTWCHYRKAIRSFSIDAITHVELLIDKVKEVDYEQLNKQLGSGYGIFSGADTSKAILRFTPQRARWVAKETWHADQTSYTDEQGFYYLELPYSQPTELIMDILKFGSDVEVLEPVDLREQVIQKIKEMSEMYITKTNH